MNDKLTQEEQEILSIFYYFKSNGVQEITYQNIIDKQRKYRSRSNNRKVSNLVNILIVNEYIACSKKTNTDLFFITKKGEDYIRGKDFDTFKNIDPHKQIIINNPQNVNIGDSNVAQINAESSNEKTHSNEEKKDKKKSFVKKHPTLTWTITTLIAIAAILVSIHLHNKSIAAAKNLTELGSKIENVNTQVKKIVPSLEKKKRSEGKKGKDNGSDKFFTPPSIEQGFIKLVSYDSSKKEWFGLSFINAEKLTIEYMQKLSGHVQLIEGAILFYDKPLTASSELNFNPAKTERVKVKRQVLLISKVFEIKQDNITQFWCQVKNK